MAFEIQPLGGHALEGALAGLMLCLGNGCLFFFVSLGINPLGKQGASLPTSLSSYGQRDFWISAKAYIGAFFVGRALVLEHPPFLVL
ncbi:hypothetical protein D3C84_698690 [compost metagenome]